MKVKYLLPLVLILVIVKPISLISQCGSGIVNMNYVVSTSGAGTYADPALGDIEYGFCFTLNSFFERSTNWVHGIFVRWSDIPNGVSISKGFTGEQVSQHGSRIWIWVDSLKARQLSLPGLGYYVDDGDGNPTNNYGDNGFGTPNATFPNLSPFCFIANYSCGAPILLRPVVTITGDGTTGAWRNSACPGDQIKATQGGPSNDGILIACGLILPLELLSFNGYSKDNINYLNWSGISDNKFSHYELEKRTENETNFSKISSIQVPATFKENSQHDLNSLDYNLKSTINYYRLKMVELDNTYVYSKTITIKSNNNKALTSVLLYPNPVEDELQLEFANTNVLKNYHLDLVSIDGRSLITKDFTIKGNSQKELINLKDIFSGVYFIKLSSENVETEVYKFVKK